MRPGRDLGRARAARPARLPCRRPARLRRAARHASWSGASRAMFGSPARSITAPTRSARSGRRARRRWRRSGAGPDARGTIRKRTTSPRVEPSLADLPAPDRQGLRRLRRGPDRSGDLRQRRGRRLRRPRARQALHHGRPWVRARAATRRSTRCASSAARARWDAGAVGDHHDPAPALPARELRPSRRPRLRAGPPHRHAPPASGARRPR